MIKKNRVFISTCKYHFGKMALSVPSWCIFRGIYKGQSNNCSEKSLNKNAVHWTPEAL
jgi:hypothetical protein